MASVESVTGPIDEGDLGRTLAHEHFRFSSEGVRYEWPHVYDDEFEWKRAVEDAEAVMGHGVKTLLDPNAVIAGRDVGFLKRLAEETGLQIIACTGIYSYDYLPQFFMNRDVDAMTECFVHDIEDQIQGTGIKAAFLKCAADEPGVTDNIEKIHRACAQASKSTGAPIMAHSHPTTETGLRQLEVFEEEGVEPAKVQIAHTGDTEDLDYIEKLLERGAFIGMDRYGLDPFIPPDVPTRNKVVLELLERGYLDRMLLGCDCCSTIDWYPEEVRPQLVPNWHMTLLFEEVIPGLLAGGATDEQIATMLDENPRRWLTA